MQKTLGPIGFLELNAIRWIDAYIWGPAHSKFFTNKSCQYSNLFLVHRKKKKSHKHPLVSVGNWFQDPPQIANSSNAQVS